MLDLRGNGGGLLNEAVLSASIFVDDGVIVSTSSRTDGDTDYDAVGGALDPKPTVVLTNRDTASAAEILAAALEDYGLATLVGTRTYGKNTVQEVIDLAAGGALDLTIGEYVTSEGESLAGGGIEPEVEPRDDVKTPDDEGLDAGLAQLQQAAAGPMSRPAARRRPACRRDRKARALPGRRAPVRARPAAPRSRAGSAKARPARWCWPTSRRQGARVVRTLGSPRRAADVVSALIWEGGLERGFPQVRRGGGRRGRGLRRAPSATGAAT